MVSEAHGFEPHWPGLEQPPVRVCLKGGVRSTSRSLTSMPFRPVPDGFSVDLAISL
jgi:hypothetical protein